MKCLKKLLGWDHILTSKVSQSLFVYTSDEVCCVGWQYCCDVRTPFIYTSDEVCCMNWQHCCDVHTPFIYTSDEVCCVGWQYCCDVCTPFIYTSDEVCCMSWQYCCDVHTPFFSPLSTFTSSVLSAVYLSLLILICLSCELFFMNYIFQLYQAMPG